MAINTRTYGQSGLYNALYQSDLALESIELVDSAATINLTGTLQVGGVCDEPRIVEQISQTVLQYFIIRTVSITLNGIPLQEAF